MGEQKKAALYCSFCGKSQYEVRRLIAGPTVFICDECTDLCKEICVEEDKKQAALKRGFVIVRELKPEEKDAIDILEGHGAIAKYVFEEKVDEARPERV